MIVTNPATVETVKNVLKQVSTIFFVIAAIVGREQRSGQPYAYTRFLTPFFFRTRQKDIETHNISVDVVGTIVLHMYEQQNFDFS